MCVCTAALSEGLEFESVRVDHQDLKIELARRLGVVENPSIERYGGLQVTSATETTTDLRDESPAGPRGCRPARLRGSCARVGKSPPGPPDARP